MPSKIVTVGQLMKDAVAYARTHLKTFADREWKERVLLEPFGTRQAADLTRQDIDRWLSGYCKTAATANRFRAYFSLCYRLGMENGKVTTNPARLVRARKEDNSRLRFLSRDEYGKLLEIIRRDNAKHAPEFMVSVFTGIRWGEQFDLTWNQVDLNCKMLAGVPTKDPSGVVVRRRDVDINLIALEALREQREAVPHKPKDKVFPLPGPGSDCRWWFEPALAETKITDYTWHNNRHTFCSWLAIAGVNLKEIQVLAGHKTIAMTAYNAHLSQGATSSAAERLVPASK